MSAPHWRLHTLEIAAVLTTFVVFVAMVAAFQFTFGRDPEQPFREQQTATIVALADAPPASLEFSLDGDRFLITDPTDIAEFLRLLVAPEVVARHHSHPVGFVRFQLQGLAASYTLGRDSQTADEYWLELDQGKDPARTIKLLRSEALTAWLTRRGLIEE